MTDPLRTLRDELELHEDETPSLTRVDDNTLATLLTALDEARERHRTEAREAVERGLEHVPRLLRGRARRLLGIDEW